MTYRAAGVSVVLCSIAVLVVNVAQEVALEDGALGSNGGSSLGGGQAGAVTQSIDVVELVVAKGLLVDIDPSVRVGQSRGLDEIGCAHRRSHVQKVVRQGQRRALGLACKDIEHSFFGLGLDLCQVSEIVDVEVASLADLEQLVGVLVDCEDLAQSGEILDVGLGAHVRLAPMLLGQVHDLLRGTGTLDGGRGHSEEGVAALEGLDKLVSLLH